jgi:hypothetical protein
VLGKDDPLPLAAFLAFCAFGLGYGLYAFVSGSRRPAAIRRLGESGQAANATVTKLKSEL